MFGKKKTPEEVIEENRRLEQENVASVVCPHCKKIITRKDGVLEFIPDTNSLIILFACPHCKKVLGTNCEMA